MNILKCLALAIGLAIPICANASSLLDAEPAQYVDYRTSATIDFLRPYNNVDLCKESVGLSVSRDSKAMMHGVEDGFLTVFYITESARYYKYFCTVTDDGIVRFSRHIDILREPMKEVVKAVRIDNTTVKLSITSEVAVGVTAN